MFVLNLECWWSGYSYTQNTRKDMWNNNARTSRFSPLPLVRGTERKEEEKERKKHFRTPFTNFWLWHWFASEIMSTNNACKLHPSPAVAEPLHVCRTERQEKRRKRRKREKEKFRTCSNPLYKFLATSLLNHFPTPTVHTYFQPLCLPHTRTPLSTTTLSHYPNSTLSIPFHFPMTFQIPTTSSHQTPTLMNALI